MSVADASPVGSSQPVHIRRDDGVSVLEIPEDVGFDELREWLREGLPEHIESVGGRPCRLDIGARAIQLFDLRRLVNLLRDDFHIEVTGLYVEPSEVWSYAERELKLTLIPHTAPDEDPATDDVSASTDDTVSLDEPVSVPDDSADAPAPLATVDDASAPSPKTKTKGNAKERRIPGPRIESAQNDPLDELLGRPEAAGSRVHHAHRTLRSGTAIRFDGDVIVFGDVNPGAQVIATGNILVLGSLRGMVHAGASGDETSIILGFDLRPTQLRLGRKIAIAPNEDAPSGIDPTIARVRDGKIVLEPYRTRTHR